VNIYIYIQDSTIFILFLCFIFLYVFAEGLGLGFHHSHSPLSLSQRVQRVYKANSSSPISLLSLSLGGKNAQLTLLLNNGI
jgi:hypothetical protein